MINIQNYNRIAIMGGTFDPIHYGHLVTAEVVRDAFQTDLVLFIPTGKAPHKEEKDVSHHEHRYMMTMLATMDHPLFDVSRVEIDRPGETYTIDTIRELRRMCRKDATILFITGADAILQILTWKDAEMLLKICSFVAVTRPGTQKEKLIRHVREMNQRYESQIHFLEVPALAISSSDIRGRVAAGQTVKYLLPEAVERYIGKYALYRDQTADGLVKAARRYVKETLSERRYKHTLGVAEEAVVLAKRHGVPSGKAYLAALLHDCAKELPHEEKLRSCSKYGIPVDPVMQKQPDLLHGFIGAEIAREKFGVEDEDILNAIRYHTTGRPGMSVLEKIISVADAVEPNRKQDETLWMTRQAAYEDIDKSMVLSLHCKKDYTKKKGRSVHPLGEEALRYYEAKTADNWASGTTDTPKKANNKEANT